MYQDNPLKKFLVGNFQVYYFDDYIQMVRRWRNFESIIRMLFLVGFIGVSAIVIIPSAIGAPFNWQMIVLIDFSACLAAGYYAMACWVNQTSIYVSKKAIEIRHEPMRWFGHKYFDAMNIKQIYVKEKITTLSDEEGFHNGETKEYSVYMQLKTGKDKILLKDLESGEHAARIEHEMENFLGIEDAKVAGEFGK